jgi:hypothetical protein
MNLILVVILFTLLCHGQSFNDGLISNPINKLSGRKLVAQHVSKYFDRYGRNMKRSILPGKGDDAKRKNGYFLVRSPNGQQKQINSGNRMKNN